MKRSLFAVLSAAFTFAAAAHAGTDPRKCTPPGNVSTYGTTPGQTCAQMAAEHAVNHTMSGVVNLTCRSKSTTWLVWACVYGQATRRTVTVTFRALSDGWHTKVTVP